MVFKVYSTNSRNSLMYNGELHVYPEFDTHEFLPRGWPYVQGIYSDNIAVKFSKYKRLKLERIS